MGKVMGRHDWAHGEAEIRKVGLGLWRSKGGGKGSSIGYIRKRVWCYGEVRVVGLLD